MFFVKDFLWLSLICVVFLFDSVLSVAESGPCTATFPQKLSEFQPVSGIQNLTDGKTVAFKFEKCQIMRDGIPLASATDTISLKATKTKVEGQPAWLLQYICKDDTSHYLNVLLTCSDSADALSVQSSLVTSTNADPCSCLTLIVNTKQQSCTKEGVPAPAPVAAPTTAQAPLITTDDSNKHSSSSFFSKFLILCVVCALLYLTIGVSYNRFVVGSRGPQQIPNYLFWVRVGRGIKSIVSTDSGPSTGGYQRPATSEHGTAPNHNQQVPAAASAFQYDQPPLSAPSAQGSTQMNAFTPLPPQTRGGSDTEDEKLLPL